LYSLDIDETIILKWTLKKQRVTLLDPVAGFCENGNEQLGSIHGGGFIEHLNDYLLLRNVSCSMELKPLIFIYYFDCFSSSNIIRQIKSRRMRWVVHVARMGEGRNVYRVLVGKPGGETDHLKDQGIDGRMGSKWTLGRLAGGRGVDWIKLAQDTDRWRAVVNAAMNLRVLASLLWCLSRLVSPPSFYWCELF
jgi:hypothetical protein